MKKKILPNHSRWIKQKSTKVYLFENLTVQMRRSAMFFLTERILTVEWNTARETPPFWYQPLQWTVQFTPYSLAQLIRDFNNVSLSPRKEFCGSNGAQRWRYIFSGKSKFLTEKKVSFKALPDSLFYLSLWIALLIWIWYRFCIAIFDGLGFYFFCNLW